MKTNIIFGSPGTGKTTRLLQILEDLLKTYSPEEIAYVSYTREGSYQGKKRAIKQFGYTDKDFPYFATLHSIAFRQLGLKRTDVIDTFHYKSISDKLGMHFTGYYTEDLRHDDDRYLFFDSLYRNNHKAAMNYIDDLDIKKLEFVRKNYNLYKEKNHIIDYTDMIDNYIKENRSLPVKVAIIDEAQDLTTLQWKMVWTAFKDCDRIYIAGDDDQAIYQWSGADVDYFLSIRGGVEILKKSYRLPHDVLEFSRIITGKISKRVDKHFDSTGKKGLVDKIACLNELAIDHDQTYMFLSRNNFFLNGIEQYIREKGLIYKRKDKISFSPRDYKIIKTFEKVHQTKQMTSKEEQELKPFLKKNFNLNSPWYDNLNWEMSKIVYYRDVIGNKTPLDKCNIKISTIHSVKGDEADNVILLTDITKNVKNNLNKNSDSEHRVFYVGCTRAKSNLYLLQSSNKYEYNFREG